jgi:mono/diheme cytochrome c family protein
MIKRALLLSIACAVMSACSRHEAPKAVASHGATLYAQNCASCHGDHGAGPIGPSLQKLSARKNADQIAASIRNPDPPMPKLYPGTLSDADVADLTAFVTSL